MLPDRGKNNVKLYCPNGHLLREFDVSPAGEILPKEVCGYAITIIRNEMHLLGCGLCNPDSHDPFDIEGKPVS